MKIATHPTREVTRRGIPSRSRGKVIGSCWACRRPIRQRDAVDYVQDGTRFPKRIHVECRADLRLADNPRSVSFGRQTSLPIGGSMAATRTRKPKDPTEGWSEVKTGMGDMHDFNTDPVLEGVFHGSREVDTVDPQGNPQKSIIHDITNASGATVGVWGSYTINAALGQVEDGAEVRIEYLGKRDIGRGRDLKLYRVWTR